MKKYLPLIERVLATVLVLYGIANNHIGWTILAMLILCHFMKEEK